MAKSKAKAQESSEDSAATVSASGSTAVAVVENIVWRAAEKDDCLTLEAGPTVARNAEGAKLASVPAALKETELYQQLSSLRDSLEEHEAECTATIELWMLRSLPVPRNVLSAVWQDPS